MLKLFKRIMALLLLALLAVSAAHAEAYVGIQSLYDETRTPWQATYFFPNGERYAALSANYSFDVDLTPSVPNVERFPVFRIKMTPIELSEEELSGLYQDEREEIRQNYEETRNLGYAILKTGGILQEYPWADFFWDWYDEMDSAQDNPLSPDDAASIATALWQRYLRMDNIRVRGVVGYSREPRFFGEYLHNDTPEGRKTYTMEKGAYTVVGEAVFGGIPVLDASTIYQENGPAYPLIAWEVTLLDEDRFIFKGSSLEVVEEVYEDVPLLPFSRIREIYEWTVSVALDPDYQYTPGMPWENGKPLIHLQSAELGYKLSMAPGSSVGEAMDTTFVTQPVWILRGYVPEELWGGEKLRQATIAAEQTKLNHPQSMKYGLHWQTMYMCIDAQTGEVLNWPNLGDNYGENTVEILTWEGQ